MDASNILSSRGYPMNFVNLKIRSKLLFLVAVLSAVAIAVAATGLYFISDMNNATSKVGLTSSEALLGEGLNQIVVTLNRAEYVAAIDPSAATLATMKKELQRNRSEMEARLAKLEPNADEKQLELLKSVDNIHKAYLPELDDSFNMMDKYGASVQSSAAQVAINESLKKSRPTVEALESSVQEYVDYTSGSPRSFVQTAVDDAATAETFMLAIAIGGITGGA